jgi:radical SAM protein with 4Fe4S-binding SPASM domain
MMNILDQYKALLASLKGVDGRPARGHVTVTGGEPFARADIWDLLETLSAGSHPFSFGILTNGSHIDKASARRLGRLGPRFVQLSLDGGREAHDLIRGAGDHDRVVKAIRILVGEGINTMISFSAGMENYREFPAVARLGRALGVDKVWTDRMIPIGHGGAMRPLDAAQTMEYIEIVARERRLAEKSFFGRTQVAADRALQFITAGGKPYRCHAGENLITIMPDGTLYPCRRMPVACGNVMETPLIELYHGGALFRSLRDREKTPAGCQGCPYRRFCAGGLKCMAAAVNQDPSGADPGCPLAGAGRQKETSFIL